MSTTNSLRLKTTCLSGCYNRMKIYERQSNENSMFKNTVEVSDCELYKTAKKMRNSEGKPHDVLSAVHVKFKQY